MLNKKQDFTSRNSKVPGFLKSSGNFVIEVIKIVVISLAIIIPIRYFLIQPFYVKGASMEPNFYDYEYLIIDEVSYRLNNPARGEVIVLEDPRNPTRFFIKRVIGLPGERVVIQDGEIYIYNQKSPQGVRLDESSYLSPSLETRGKIDITLGEDEYYFMGDNRPASLDSRILGPIQEDKIIGRAWLRAWPFSRMEHFRTPSYNI